MVKYLGHVDIFLCPKLGSWYRLNLALTSHKTTNKDQPYLSLLKI